ncbi:ABC transporter permease [Streptosporangium sp. CA-115845]|uniref:ABC transporter permease n=1 Tax=Streptosporangium sp. CA-115845 TaxID=3240071 RepID=UPI003D8DC5E5
MTRRLAWIVTALVTVFLLVPIVVIVPVAFNASPYIEFPPSGLSLRWFENFFTSPEWVEAALVSLRVAAITTVLATVLGTLTAIGLTRTRARYLGVVNAVIALPMIVPMVAYALGVYAVYVHFGLVGSMTGLIVAHTVLALPYVVLNVSAPLQTLNPNVERAARSLGASPVRAFLTVILPQIAPGVMAGALFAFLTSFDEVVVAIFVTNQETTTLPVKMWESVQTDLDPTIAAVATMLIVTTSILLGGSALLGRKNRDESAHDDADA